VLKYTRMSDQDQRPRQIDPAGHVISQTTEVIRGAFQFVAALALNDLVKHYISVSGGGKRAKWAYAGLALVASVIMSLALVYIQHGYNSLRFMSKVSARQAARKQNNLTSGNLPLGKGAGADTLRPQAHPSHADTRPYAKLGI